MTVRQPDPTERLILGFPPRVIAWSVLGALAAAVVGVVLFVDQIQMGDARVGGDFPAFYAVGSIVLEGDLDELYDADRQLAEQEEHLNGVGGHLPFAYMPPVAAAYAPLAALPYRVAYLVHTAVMVGAVVWAFRLIRPMLPSRRPPDAVILAVAFTWIPMLAVAAGQNTALVILAFAAAWRAVNDDREWLAGLALGLLLFKPQYGVPLLGLYLVRGHWRVLPTFAATAVGWWVGGAMMLGADWFAPWVRTVAEFSATDATTNGRNAISWLGFAENALGAGDPLAWTIGATGIAATAATLIWCWRTERGLAIPIAAAASGILLTSPHSMFYDAGLMTMAVAGLAIAEYGHLKRLVLALWFTGLAHPYLARNLGFSILFFAVVVTFALTVAFWRRREDRSPPEPMGRPAGGPVALSVIVPAFDEAGRIEPTLRELATWAPTHAGTVEVIVVDDGSTDGTSDRALALSDSLPNLQCIRFPTNRGKGAAVRAGMLAARGDWRVFLDADGSTSPDQVPRLLAPGDPVVIGSVAARDATLERAQSELRSSAGRFGNRLIQRLVLPGIEDSQRGCKAFRGDVAETIFSQCVIDRWGFDVEVLARSRALGHEPVEVGVVWEDRPVGHVRPWHYLTTLIEVLRIRRLVGYQRPVAQEAFVSDEV